MTTLAAPRFVTPTPRQVEVLTLFTQGLTDQEIADRLDVGITTVRTLGDELRDRLGARNRAHAVALGFEYRILPAPGETND